MTKNIKEVLLASEGLFIKSQYLKAKAILEAYYPEACKLDGDLLLKFSILYSKIVNRISTSKPDLKKSEFLLSKCYSSLQSIQKKVPHNLIYQIFLTTYTLSSIYSKQSKTQFALAYLKRLCEIPLPKQSSSKLIYLKSKVFTNLSSIYIELSKYQESLNYAKMALNCIQEVILTISGSSSISTLSQDSIKDLKDKFSVFIISNLHIAVSLAELASKYQSTTYFEIALKYSQLLEDTHLIFIVQQKMNEYAHRGTKQNSDPNSKSKSFNRSSSGFFGGVYYSTERLNKVSNCLDIEPRFISTDEFFQKKIRSELGVQNYNQKHVCGKQKDLQEIEKKAISYIRQKKHQRSSSNAENFNQFDKRLDLIKKESEDIINKQSVKIRSKLRTRSSKNLIKNFSVQHRNLSQPQQKLFFKPPVETSSPSKRGSIKKHSVVTLDAKSSSKLKEIAKNEIESFLLKINEDMKDKHETDEKIREESKLALSAQKGLFNMRETRNALKRTLANAILGKRRTNTPNPLNSFLKVAFK